MALRNRFSAFAKHAAPANPIRAVRAAKPVFAHPVPATVDRDRLTQIERHAFDDGSVRYVRPGQHGHGTHKRPTTEQAAQAAQAKADRAAAKQAREAARAVRAEPAKATRPDSKRGPVR